MKYFKLFVYPVIVLSNAKARAGEVRERIQNCLVIVCLFECYAKENFNEYNSSKLHTDDSGSCLVWHFQENTVTLATSISHGTCCSMQNVSTLKSCPSAGDHTRKRENK